MGERTCVIDDCAKPVRAREWCVTHYHRWHRTGNPLQVQVSKPKLGVICSVSGCGGPVSGRGWCGGHYRRWSIHGDPLVGGPLAAKPGPRPCPIAGCTKLTRKNGLCTAHDQRQKAHGNPNHGGKPVQVRPQRLPDRCAEDGCPERPIALEWCRLHYRRRYYELHPEARRYEAALRRVRKLNNGGGALVVTDRDWRRLLIAYRNACAYCGKTGAALEVEHVIPVSRGGRHAIGNIVPACGSCNRKKSDRLLVEWRHDRRRPRPARVIAM